MTAAAASAAKAKLTHAEAAKALRDVTVRVPKLDREGKFVVDSKTKQTVVIERAPTEADVFAVNDHGSKFHVVLVDGQKHAIEK